MFAVVVVGCLLRGTGTFVYDADTYWTAATWFTHGAPHTDVINYLTIRGILTIPTFAPAALLTWVGGANIAGFAVLLQNSLLIGWTAAFLLPRAIAPWRRIGIPTRWITGGLCWLALSGFAPYPLVDLYAVVAVVAAVTLLSSRKPLMVAGAGALLAYAINIRPAYLPVAAVLLLVTVATHRWRTVLLAPGALVALAPQIIYNALVNGALALTPVATDGLAGLQMGYASYVVRYDTALGAGDARQFFCSPAMAGAIGTPPTSTVDLLSTFVHQLPNSAIFALEKVAAALHWPVSIPYLTEAKGWNLLFAIAITAIAVAGCMLLIALAILRRSNIPMLGASARAVAVIAATMVTIVGSASEARFALPLVIFGIIGTACLIDVGILRVREHEVLAVATVIAAFLVFGLGSLGLSHPAPRGDVTPDICAAETSEPSTPSTPVVNSEQMTARMESTR